MSHEPLVLGIDAGGTSTRALLSNSRGDSLGFGAGGRGNPVSAGAQRAATGVLTAVEAALATSGASLAEIPVIVAAMAGMQSSANADWLLGPLTERGFRGTLTFEADLLAIYFSGAAAAAGYAMVSGTGACMIRVEDGDVAGTADGLGWLLGDRGSGFWIGQQVIRAVAEDLDGTGAGTSLTRRVLEHYDLATTPATREGRPEALWRLVATAYDRAPIELAALTPAAFDAAQENDAVAIGILREAGQQLARSLRAILRAPGPLVIGGSVLSRAGVVRDAFLATLGEAADALVLRNVGDGAVGAAMLALRAHGTAPDETVRERLTATLQRFR
ncbi:MULTISPECIES: N-acetylglucosamine kinase [Microbacterium]|uniref:N-acetylglucosamine kinase n=1 Tax=Microbacterium TaxID=33882 RepID=UPI001E3150AA|nr:BadF/BadG/BcrA/BcrD ATPase family protein [Microbacterium nymphoidis]MCD2500115.1 hypothetical protein [Microbacterium nymphoidis]